MKIESSFYNGSRVPVLHTADGKNINPKIIISDIPIEAKSLILIVDDPDAKREVGYTWFHWIVFNIPVHFPVTVIEENSIPGLAGESTYKKKEYGGPNPPRGSGAHHYHFKIYAISKMLNFPEMSSVDKIIKEAEKNILAVTELVGVYDK